MWVKKESDKTKRYLILDRGVLIDRGDLKSSSFKLMDTFDKRSNLRKNKSKDVVYERNILHETYYGICRKPQN